MNFLTSLDDFINHHAAHPALAIIFTSLFIITVIVPEFKKWFYNHKAIQELWKLRESGADLRNRHIHVHNAASYKTWEREYEKWRKELLDACEKISTNLRNWNAIVNVMEIHKIPPFASPYEDGDFIINYRVIGENLNRIERYLVSEFFKREWWFICTNL